MLACFVHIRQAQSGAPFTVEPLVRTGVFGGSSPAHSGGGGNNGESARNPTAAAAAAAVTLPPIRQHLDRSPVRTAPANMRRRSVQTGLNGSRGGGGGNIVIRQRHNSGAKNKPPVSSLYRKFKQMEKEDLRAGRIERSNTRVGGAQGWKVPKGSFVRTGDRCVCTRAGMRACVCSFAWRALGAYLACLFSGAWCCLGALPVNADTRSL